MSRPIKVSQSELTAKKVLDKYFGNIKHLDNYRPEWLKGLELDRFYPSLGVAIEFQGDQHSRVVPGMHKGPSDFQRQVDLDTQKRHNCEKRGIKLYSINLLDLDRFRVVDFAKKIAKDGSDYTLKNGDKNEHYKISRIRFDPPEEHLMRKVDRLSHIRKSYYQPGKKSWWQRIFGI
jgi:hypothetical protein